MINRQIVDHQPRKSVHQTPGVSKWRGCPSISDRRASSSSASVGGRPPEMPSSSIRICSTSFANFLGLDRRTDGERTWLPPPVERAAHAVGQTACFAQALVQSRRELTPQDLVDDQQAVIVRARTRQPDVSRAQPPARHPADRPGAAVPRRCARLPAGRRLWPACPPRA